MAPRNKPTGGLSSGKKICLVILILGMLALIIGGVAPYWLTNNEYNIGLWYQCSNIPHCDHYRWPDKSFPDFNVWFYVIHATAGLAIVLSFVCLLVALGKLCGDKDTGIPLAVTLLLAGCFGIAASVIFYVKGDSEGVSPGVTAGSLNWSFYLFAAGTGLTALFSCFLVCIPKDKSRVHPY